MRYLSASLRRSDHEREARPRMDAMRALSTDGKVESL